MTSTGALTNSAARPLRPRQRLLIAVSALAAVFAGSALPTPLYRIYQEDLALSSAMLTTVFAAYAFALLATLLTAGGLADVLGRRPVIVVSLLLTTVAMGVFTLEPSVLSLLSARIVQGIANGVALGALGAEILDADLARGPFMNSVAPFAGMSAGALLSGILVTYAGHPTMLVYALFLVLCLALAAATLYLPAPARVRAWSPALLLPRVAIPPQARKTFARVSLTNVSAWALGGYFLSLMPSLIRQALHLQSPVTGAAAVALLAASAGVATAIVRPYSLRTAARIGEGAFLCGLGLTLAGLALPTTALLFVGSVLAGFGMGACFFAASRELLPLAAADERAALLSAFYVESYLAFSLPAIVVGVLAPKIGLATTTNVFGAVLALLAIASFTVRDVLPFRSAS